jgi:uncharacterized membrane protein YeaQ/YmgE (transglycosylase-associated protein family)
LHDLLLRINILQGPPGNAAFVNRARRIEEGNRMSLLYWLVVGLIAGWLAGLVMKGGGYGIVVDIVLGILGGFLGGWIFSSLGIGAGAGFAGSVIVAFVGAVVLVAITRVLKKA